MPLHIMGTMPWTPTKSFPHPMTVVQSINVAGAHFKLQWCDSAVCRPLGYQPWL